MLAILLACAAAGPALAAVPKLEVPDRLPGGGSLPELPSTDDLPEVSDLPVVDDLPDLDSGGGLLPGTGGGGGGGGSTGGGSTGGGSTGGGGGGTEPSNSGTKPGPAGESSPGSSSGGGNGSTGGKSEGSGTRSGSGGSQARGVRATASANAARERARDRTRRRAASRGGRQAAGERPFLDGSRAGPAETASSANAEGKEAKKRPLLARVLGGIPSEYRVMLLFLGGIATLFGLISLREHIRSRRALRHASRDPLTHLPNRNAFEQRLDREWRRAERFRRPLGLLLLDLDGFKQVNDSAGHQEGDRVLALAGATLAREVRGSDMAARLGGDEFVVLCPETEGSELHATGRRLAEAFERAGVRVSVGHAERSTGDRAPDDLLERADAAMYREKERRRGVRPARAPSLVPAPAPAQ